jgi:hypothetical protein
MLILRPIGEAPTLQQWSDELFASMSDNKHPFIVTDSTLTPTSRVIFWRGQLQATPYVILDKFALVGTLYVHARSAMPLRKETPIEWHREYAKALDAFLSSLTVGNKPVFPEGSGIGMAPF